MQSMFSGEIHLIRRTSNLCGNQLPARKVRPGRTELSHVGHVYGVRFGQVCKSVVDDHLQWHGVP